MVIKEIDYNQYENFNNKFGYDNVFQSAEMTKVRKVNYEDVKVLGLFDHNQIIGTTQILIEVIPYINKKIGTSIKGLNFDISNVKLLTSFNVAMKQYLKENNFLFFRTDLNVATNFYDGEFNLLEEKQNPINFPYDKNIRKKMEESGYEEFYIDSNYMGRSPQWSMIIDTANQEVIKSQFNRSVKRAIKLAHEIGVEVIKTNKSEVDIEEFYKLHKLNANKNNINIMDINYYKELFTCPYINLYLVKINKKIMLEYTTKKYESNPSAKNEKLLNQAKNYTENEYVLAHVSSMKGDIGYDMFTGLNYEYKDLGTKECLMEFILQDALENDIMYYDFWGIVAGKQYDKDPLYPIYLFKKKFSNIIVEYPGFWDIYTNKYLYKLFIKLYKIRYKRRH